jgi:glycine cleavage system regulatory protein
MQIPLVMTIISPDRTGIVESVARAVAEHGGNWLESRMCRLGGEFAGILRVEISAEKKPVLLAALQKLQANGLQIVVRDDQPVLTSAPGGQTKLEIVGSDRPGIVREITAALARANVNVEEFSSEVVSAPMSGETLFKAGARLQLPEGCDVAALKKDLEKIAADLLVDVSFGELSDSASGI